MTKQRRTSTDEVVRELERRIHSSELTADEKLPSEAALAIEFAVSRTVIRESLGQALPPLDHRDGVGAESSSGRCRRALHPAGRRLRPRRVWRLARHNPLKKTAKWKLLRCGRQRSGEHCRDDGYCETCDHSWPPGLFPQPRYDLARARPARLCRPSHPTRRPPRPPCGVGGAPLQRRCGRRRRRSPALSLRKPGSACP